jgi:hypothetical protein
MGKLLGVAVLAGLGLVLSKELPGLKRYQKIAAM